MEGMLGFHLSTRRMAADMAVVEMRGEMDTLTAPQAKEAMLGLLSEGYRHLIVNLRKIDYIDSTGLGVLVSAPRAGTRRRDRLVAPPNHVRRLFEITRLTYSFPIDASEEDAAQQFAHVE